VSRFPEIYWLDFSEEAGTKFMVMGVMVCTRQILLGLSNQRG
jgi:hypothetical protein